MKEDFDKIFKSKLENYSSEYPDQMWGNIEQALHPKKKDRFGWYVLSISILALVGVGAFVGLSDSNLKKSDSAMVSLKDKLVSNTAETSELVEENIIANNSNEAELEPVVEALQHQIIPFEESVSDALEPKLPEVKEDSFFKNKMTQQTSANEIKRSALIEVSTPDQNKSKLKEKTRNKRTIIFTESILPEKDRLDNALSVKKSNLLDNRLNRHQVLNSLNALPLGIELQKKPELNLNMSVAPGTDCPSWVKDKMGLYLEAYYAPEFALRSLTAKSRDSIVTVNQIMRNQTESELMSFSLGARLMFMTPKGISFKLGLNYSQINERFTFVDPESIKYITIADVDPVSGDTLSVMTYTEYGSEKEKIVNRYRSFDFPLLIGFEKYRGNKWSYSFDGGIYLNLVSQQRGKFISPDGTRLWFTSDNDVNYKAFKRSLGVSVFASAGFMYHWVEGIDFFFRPSVRFYTQSFTLDNYPLNQNYVVVGIHTGLRYRF